MEPYLLGLGGVGLIGLCWAGWRRLRRAKRDWDKNFRNGKGLS